MHALDLSRLDADAFLDRASEWAARDLRRELDRGEVVAMAPEQIGHARAKNAVLRALERAIGDAGLGCEAMPDGVGLRVSNDTVYEPDAMLRCGPPAPADVLAIDDPILVVEVISPSSASRDAITKLAGYATIPSIRHYLLVDPEGGITHYRRQSGEARFEVTPTEGDRLVIEPPGITVDLTALRPEP